MGNEDKQRLTLYQRGLTNDKLENYLLFISIKPTFTYY